MKTSKLCECGCGQVTGLARQTDKRSGTVKGEPLRFISRHTSRSIGVHFGIRYVQQPCKCGCDGLAPLHTQTGWSRQYVPGHQNRKPPVDTARSCAVCDVWFTPPYHWATTRSTCSPECWHELVARKLRSDPLRIVIPRQRIRGKIDTIASSRSCVQCGSPIATEPIRGYIRKTCSQACRNAYFGQQVRGPNNPNWKEIKALHRQSTRALRRKVLARDKTCRDCSTDSGLQVHHIDRNRLNNAPENVVALCGPCHASRHEALGEWNLRGLILSNRRARIPLKVCANCGEEFQPKKREQICCSPACGRTLSGRTRLGSHRVA